MSTLTMIKAQLDKEAADKVKAEAAAKKAAKKTTTTTKK